MHNSLTIVIFGATGDLYQSKLANALFDLFIKDSLPRKLSILGFGRRPLGNVGVRTVTREAIMARKTKNNIEYKTEHLEEFLNKIHYFEGNLENIEDFKKLGVLMSANDAEVGICSNKLFYLAVPPKLYEIIFKNISLAGLTVPCASGVSAKEVEDSWTRVLVEKPFGKDLEQAERLDALLSELFDESQIFRIDHYLAKETMQKILDFRFKDSVLEKDWNNQHIEKIKIIFHESNTLASRGAFYEGMGAIRDVGQNHMLQMLALVAMKNPGEMSPSKIQNARVEVLEKIKLFPNSKIIRAQYDGYVDEANVSPDSKTETFFHLSLSVDDVLWKGVRFEFEGGKALEKTEVFIEVCFKDTAKNIVFPVSSSAGASYDAYEKVFYDCISGDQTVFTSTREVLAEWKLITSIICVWQDMPLIVYNKGSRVEEII